MRKIVIVAAIFVALAAAPAKAQSVRTFVSPTGNDSAACSLTAPCRTFAAAYAVTNAGGEIAVLGTAGYGPLTINKAISIVNGGGFEAAIAVPSGAVGITISAGTMDAVSLRGLTIDGAGVGFSGITFGSGKSLTIENCVVRRMTQIGINFYPANASALTVSNTQVAENGDYGISVYPGGSATAVFNHVEVTNNGSDGISLDGGKGTTTDGVKATVSDSLAAGNGHAGFLSYSISGAAPTSLTVFHSVAANNVLGVGATGIGTVRLAQSALTDNTTGWNALNGGVVYSYGDNYIDGNGANQGYLTPIPKQ
jgi:hypothetical protein